ncbi:MAG: hypothetical protein IJS96_06815 [Schwartzia sp.]|nr:hypothetical protein [Schwartzia sp. (in: firmicutes)]
MVFSFVTAIAAGLVANVIYDLLKSWHQKRQGGASHSEPGAKQGGGR